jgi:hypothetical protein
MPQKGAGGPVPPSQAQPQQAPNASPLNRPAPPPTTPGQANNGLFSQWGQGAMDKLERISGELKKKTKDQASQSRELLNAYKSFEAILNEMFDDIKNDKSLNAKKLSDARTALLQELSRSEMAENLPLLQRFLRADVLHLISSIEAAKTATDSLKKAAAEYEKTFKNVIAESSKMESSSRPFWQANV